MREGRASLTASFIAFSRGLGAGRDRPDPTAAALLPGSAAAALRTLLRLGRWGAPLRLATRVASAGLVDHVVLRTAAIDAAVMAAVHRGCDQLVILGAGLDGRAWRLPCLADVDVFELDHPDTQVHKRRGVEGLERLARSVRFVAVDFEREGVGKCLAELGHDGERRTLWILEGVIQYLAPVAITATLQDIGQRSAAGSELAMTYAIPGIVPSAQARLDTVVRVAFSALFWALGEPLIGTMDSQTVADRLQTVGFEVASDSGSPQWADASSGRAALAFPFSGERLTLATKR